MFMLRIQNKLCLQETGGMVDLCAAQIVFASMDDSSGIPVNNVEQCVCPLQYTVSADI